MLQKLSRPFFLYGFSDKIITFSIILKMRMLGMDYKGCSWKIGESQIYAEV